MIYITGDTHGEFFEVEVFCRRKKTSKNEDTLIILGDAGFNYWISKNDRKLKQRVNGFPITIFSIHGNHEERPYNITTYHEIEYRGGIAYVEDDYPSLIFAKDGEVYDFDGIKCLVIGGAYSVDKEYRLLHHAQWFSSEQPDDDIKKRVEDKLDSMNWKIDVVLSHTTPIDYEPVEVFLPWLNQSEVDNSTERWLGEIEKKLDYKKWYAGHFHTSKEIDKFQLMYHDFGVLNTKTR